MKKSQTHQIIIFDTDGKEHRCTVDINLNDDQIIAITEAATIHASSNGYEYDLWDFADNQQSIFIPPLFTEPTCTECGQPLSTEDVEAGETTCLDCAGAEFMAEIDLESPLLATVAVRLKELK